MPVPEAVWLTGDDCKCTGVSEELLAIELPAAKPSGKGCKPEEAWLRIGGWLGGKALATAPGLAWLGCRK